MWMQALVDGTARVRRTTGPVGTHAFSLDRTGALRPLDAREREAMRLAGLGFSSKEIAFELGVSLSSAGRALVRAARALGLTNRIDLAIVAAALSGAASDTARLVALEDESVLLIASPSASPLWAQLSPAERHVAHLALAGHRGASIASHRGARSPHTVHNQLGRVFRKVGASGRAELAARLIATGAMGSSRSG